MARIRSIKPEFFTSEQVAECSTNARLLFIGMWCFCDDQGIHPASVARLKMEVFPGDDFTKSDIAAMADELVTHGLLQEYEVEGEKFWLVTGWKHQKIDKPSKKYPLPVADDSSNARRKVSDHSGTEGSGCRGDVEGKELEPAIAGLSPAAPDDDASATDDSGEQPDGRPPCPHVRIIALYHEVLPELRQVREWNETRRRLLQRRWTEAPERQSADWWREFFGYVRKSRFLMGRTTGRDGRPFDCDLEWLIRPTNFAKVIEGKYEDEAA